MNIFTFEQSKHLQISSDIIAGHKNFLPKNMHTIHSRYCFVSFVKKAFQTVCRGQLVEPLGLVWIFNNILKQIFKFANPF
jgi:hypothetical protein